MSKSTRWGAGVLAVFAALLLVWAFMPRPVKVEVAHVEIGPFEASIDEDGRTRVRDRYVVTAPLAGTLARITLREGDSITTGDVLAQLAPLPPTLTDRRAVLAQRAAVALAEAALERANARVAGAEVKLASASSNLVRSERLVEKKLIAAAALEDDQMAAQAAQREYEAAMAERHMAEHDLELARTALAAVGNGKDVQTFELRSPVTGQVLRVLRESEGSVAMGTPLLEIGDTTRLEVVADLLTTEAVRIRPGQPVHIERWGGGRSLKGRVQRVEPGAFTKISALGVEEQRVRTVVDFEDPPETRDALGDGFRVSLRIVVDAAEEAISVPLGALFPHRDGGMAVFRLEEGRVALTEVEVRARGAATAWIGKGLDPGQAVVVYPRADLVDGARVERREAR